jgi:hypothetical protein
MTETEWLACEDPGAMLKHLQRVKLNRNKRGRRKLTLFGCACCRRVWRLLTERGRRWVQLAERKADGALSKEEVHKLQPGIRGPNHNLADRAAWFTGSGNAMDAAMFAANCAAEALGREAYFPSKSTVSAWQRAREEEHHQQAVLLREIVGNPVVSVCVNPIWQTWGEATIPRLARAIYDEQGFDRLGVLADALEDAGCDNADLIGHCRRPGEHVRGCWVVDLLAGKE